MKHKNIDWDIIVVISISSLICIFGLTLSIYEPLKTTKEQHGYFYRMEIIENAQAF